MNNGIHISDGMEFGLRVEWISTLGLLVKNEISPLSRYTIPILGDYGHVVEGSR